MRLFDQPLQADAFAYAKAGGQALHLLGLTPARLYDKDLRRLVATARELGMPDVCVAFTGTPRQHVVIKGWPLVKAVVAAGEASNVLLVDVLTAAEVAS